MGVSILFLEVGASSATVGVRGRVGGAAAVDVVGMVSADHVEYMKTEWSLSVRSSSVARDRLVHFVGSGPGLEFFRGAIDLVVTVPSVSAQLVTRS